MGRLTPTSHRVLSWVLTAIMIADVGAPTAYALSSGPSQPEVQGFTPASAEDMVNLFTGDMSYNIPLLDVEGYPVNLAYNAGPNMDQEASWVGLGWNLNTGVVERTLRGLPDDFSGDPIERRLNLRPNRTFGLGYGVGLQIFGGVLGLNLNISPGFNNYTGPQFDTGISLSLRSTKSSGPNACASLGLNSSSNSGMRLQPSIGFDYSNKPDRMSTTAGLNFGLTIDSRQGLTNYSFGATASVSSHHQVVKGTDGNYSYADGKAQSLGSVSAGASFDVGHPTYTPMISLPMTNYSMSAAFTLGGQVFGTHPNMSLSGFYSEQRLASNTISRPAYGYMYLHNGQHTEAAVMDLNREKDGSYSGDRAGLPLASLTSDVFAVSGQGMSGSYRPFRSEVGHVFDAKTSSTGVGASISGEIGGGNAVHGGGSVIVNSSNSHSSVWTAGNMARNRLRFRNVPGDPLYEPVFFREANEPTVEQDPAVWNAMQQGQAMRFTLPGTSQFECGLGPMLTRNGGGQHALPATNHRTKREPRAQLFTYLTRAEAEELALDALPTHNTDVAKPHHIGEISILGTDGQRYYYGMPVYNVSQTDVEFNVGDAQVTNGMVGYTSQQAGTENTEGRDHFYSASTTPPYAYAWLLTAKVSQDYADVDGTRGPSDGDNGTWTKFVYEKKHDAFEWRTPAHGTQGAQRARHMEGLQGSNIDDKGTYVYGTKEVRYLQEIETRNFIAMFRTSARGDGKGVNEQGAPNAQVLYKLDRIDLYSKNDLNTPIKSVHFAYDESLCPGAPNAANGKLTLRKVWFTYGTSNLGYTAPYKFTYGTGLENPPYAALAQDRWGTTKPDDLSTGFWNDPAFGASEAATTRNADFPYAEQDKALADLLASAWCLKTITLPSGGTIKVTYESDDYAHVQHKRAMRMYKIESFTGGIHPLEPEVDYSFHIPPDQLPASINTGVQGWEDLVKAELLDGVDLAYFRFKVRTAPPPQLTEKDYVSGYARPGPVTITDDGTNGLKVSFSFESVGIDDGGAPCNPVRRAALEFFQVNYPELIHNNAPQWTDDSDITEGFFYSMISSVSGFVTGIGGFFTGPNQETLTKRGGFDAAELSGSYIRLNVVNHRKLGGGHRVKSVRFSDEWMLMETPESDEAAQYGTNYTYGDAEGSWGVAAFEPLTGADENPFRQPIYSTVSRTLSPDERFYQELPFGETLFPSPVVGYAKVVVEDAFPSAASRAVHGTGRSVHEFYTARDFPTITDRTTLHPERRRNSWNILALLKLKVIDHMHATQGYVVETNDMHGKPKRISVYPEGSNSPISTEEYVYASEPMGNARRLVNQRKVITPDGQVGTAEIGLQYEFTADMREFVQKATSGGADVNVEVFLVAAFPATIPIVLPKYSSSSTRYRTGVLTKKIHRFGQLERVVRMSHGSTVTTENLAYDALTGSVLATMVRNGFEDPIYSFSVPAYWHYASMGPAYQNVGARFQSLTFGGTGEASLTDAARYFTPGDELAFWPSGQASPQRVWVDEVQPGAVRVIDAEGDPVSGTGAVKVLRSGRRNMQAVNMMELSLQEDPVAALASNAYGRVLDAKVRVFKDEWPMECLCLEGEGAIQANDWQLGRKGQWRLHKEMAWLTARARSVYDDNTNIRRDGAYTAFAPFYQVQNGAWVKEPAGWTTAREVTMYNHRGQELENRDALGLYSAVTFGHAAMLPTAVGRNTRYREIGFESFEELPQFACDEKHFRFVAAPAQYEQNDGHTGRRSLRVTPNNPVHMVIGEYDCSEGGCLTDLVLTAGGPAAPYQYTVMVANGTAPYNLSYDQLDGDPISCTPISGGLGITSTGAWTATFHVVDGAGCAANLTVTP